MSTITKEQIEQYANAARLIQVSDFDKGKLITIAPDHMLELARIALESLEAEPAEWRVVFRLDGQPGSDFEKTFENQARMNEIISLHERAGFSASITPLYTAPPAPVSVNITRDQIRDIFMSNGFTIKDGQTDLKDYVYAAADELVSLLKTQAQVSVPDDVSGPLAHAYKELTPTLMRNHIAVFERYGIYPDGSAGIQAMRIALDGMNRRDAMLQGAEPVTTAYKLPANIPCRDAPEHIWLQTAGIWPENGEFSELTWCSDNQHPDDTLYVRADVVAGNSPVIPDGWVACSERMPEREIDVQVYCSDKNEQMVGYMERNERDGYFRFSSLPNGVGIYCQPTHWMPLPAAPQQEVK